MHSTRTFYYHSSGFSEQLCYVLPWYVQMINNQQRVKYLTKLDGLFLGMESVIHFSPCVPNRAREKSHTSHGFSAIAIIGRNCHKLWQNIHWTRSSLAQSAYVSCFGERCQFLLCFVVLCNFCQFSLFRLRVLFVSRLRSARTIVARVSLFYLFHSSQSVRLHTKIPTSQNEPQLTSLNISAAIAFPTKPNSPPPRTTRALQEWFAFVPFVCVFV